ncbi:MAG: indole-3-glycerol phosphate synthase TrpC [Deinococcales bacterium]
MKSLHVFDLPFTKALRTSQIQEGLGGVLAKIALERIVDYEAKPIPLSWQGLDGHGAPFFEALAKPGLSVIAEVKRSSPSKGAIADLDPVATAKAYAQGGAGAISVLTETRHFGGELEHLIAVAKEVSLPLLRKDFTVHPFQLLEAKQAGASAVLLIVAILGELTADYLKLAKALELDALVEIHDEAELSIALAAGAEIIGVNNRDLRSLAIDLNNAPKLIRKARGLGFQGLLVAESGYSQRQELEGLRDLADAVLIGSSLAASHDIQKALENLVLR